MVGDSSGGHRGDLEPPGQSAGTEASSVKRSRPIVLAYRLELQSVLGGIHFQVKFALF